MEDDVRQREWGEGLGIVEGKKWAKGYIINLIILLKTDDGCGLRRTALLCLSFDYLILHSLPFIPSFVCFFSSFSSFSFFFVVFFKNLAVGFLWCRSR